MKPLIKCWAQIAVLIAVWRVLTLVGGPSFREAYAAPLAPRTSPLVVGFERFARPLAEQSAVGGDWLLGELNCTACHETARVELQPKRGPNLKSAGLRLRTEWLRTFLENPNHAKPGTTMPDLLHGLEAGERTAAVNALVAFLTSRRAPFKPQISTGSKPVAQQFWAKGNRTRGKQFYHQLGCVACHDPDKDERPANVTSQSALDKLLQQLDPEEIQELGLADTVRRIPSISLAHLKAKTTRQALAHFLLDPAAIRPGDAMPAFRLTPSDAADLTAFLLDGQSPAARSAKIPAADAGLVDQGKRLFADLGCASCHDAGVKLTAKPARPLARLDASAGTSCVRKPPRAQPRYPLDDAQRVAVAAAVREAGKSDGQIEPADELDGRLVRANCYACHRRDRRGGVGPRRRPLFETAEHVDLGDEGRLPPSLTGVGRKLTTPALTSMLNGLSIVRPHVLARMPVYPPAIVKPLPGLFAKVDRPAAKTAKDVFGDLAGLAEPGRKLVDTGCVQCHPVQGDRLPGVLGIDLSTARTRLRPEWLREFLLDPAKLKPRTRMPTFFPKGKSSHPDLLGGDVPRQLSALYAYLSQVDKLPLPDKIAKGKLHNFELVPKDRPLILRTFMKQAGLQAIAVGFPRQVHIAIDADQVRLAQIWRGRFLDAHGTWFDRFVPPAKPLGSAVVDLGSGPEFRWYSGGNTPAATLPQSGESPVQFGGYRLDRRGVPTFLYRHGQVTVEDRFEPTTTGQLKRFITVTVADRPTDKRTGGTVWFRALVAKTLTAAPKGGYRDGNGLTVTVNSATAPSPVKRDGSMRWWVPLSVGGSGKNKASLEVSYRW